MWRLFINNEREKGKNQGVRGKYIKGKWRRDYKILWFVYGVKKIKLYGFRSRLNRFIIKMLKC